MPNVSSPGTWVDQILVSLSPNDVCGGSSDFSANPRRGEAAAARDAAGGAPRAGGLPEPLAPGVHLLEEVGLLEVRRSAAAKVPA